MVRDNTKRNVALFVGVIFNAGDFCNVFHNVLDCVNLKKIVDILSNTGKPFKTHACINIGMGKRSIMIMSVVLKLSENEVPKLNISVALAAYLTIRLSATVLGSSVVINLRARAARTCSVLPEVILLAEANHVALLYAYLLCPDVISLVIIEINAYIEPFGIHLNYLGAEFPCPCNGIMLKIIAEGEIAEHFKICSVTRGFSDILDIGRSDTFLTCSNSRSRRGDLARKIFFHRRHSCIDKQKAFVALRNKRKARESQMTLALVKRKKFFS